MTVYYVDSVLGDDSRSGLSPALAWYSMDKVNAATLNAGDWVLFKCGCSWYHQLTIMRNGSVGNWITFSSYGTGTRPIIYGNYVHMCACSIPEGYHHIRVENIDFSGSTQSNYSSVMAYSHDLYFYNCIFRDGKNCGYSSWTSTGGSIYNVVVDTCYAHNNSSSGIMISSVDGSLGPHDCEVKYCITHDNGSSLWWDHGIYVRYGAIVHDCINYNHAFGGGLKVNSEGQHSSYSPILYNNICYDNFIGIVAGHQDTLIYNNWIHDNTFGINLDSDSHDMMIIYNTIVNSLDSNFRVEGDIANTTIENNLIIEDRAVVPMWLYGGESGKLLSYLAAHNSIDYNTYYTNGITSTDVFTDVGGNYNWTEWKAFAGSPDANSTFLTDLPEVTACYTDMHPIVGGNLEGLGVAIGGYTLDKDGLTRADPPTPGCYEAEGVPPIPPPVSLNYGPSVWMDG
jgi:hypothetical protein